MRHVIWRCKDTKTRISGFRKKADLEKDNWTFMGEPVAAIAEFEAETSDEAREKFDAWDDAQESSTRPRPEERCDICDALRAEGRTIPTADTSSGTTWPTAEPATGRSLNS